MIERFFSDPVHDVIGAVFGLLIFASLVAAILQRLKPGPAAAELSKRVTSWSTSAFLATR